mmetsp:Transcript_39998/g.103309  ORF Transcript_39998/g.103309 Transcript_39998/m.103309 type:complete len:209 (+) Transcript_39998:13697-14323(+)
MEFFDLSDPVIPIPTPEVILSRASSDSHFSATDLTGGSNGQQSDSEAATPLAQGKGLTHGSRCPRCHKAASPSRRSNEQLTCQNMTCTAVWCKECVAEWCRPSEGEYLSWECPLHNCCRPPVSGDQPTLYASLLSKCKLPLLDIQRGGFNHVDKCKLGAYYYGYKVDGSPRKYRFKFRLRTCRECRHTFHSACMTHERECFVCGCKKI